MKKLALFLFCLLPVLVHSQNAWQWAKEGGSTNTLGGGDQNEIIQIESDQNGNIYLLGRIGGIGIKIDGQADTGYSTGINGTLDILLCSFTPHGQLRWKKIIGGDVGDYGHSLKLDSKGHVYVSGKVTPVFPGQWAVPVHFDTDTILPTSAQYNEFKKIMFLAQYDTAGNFNWLRMPEPDTVTLANQVKYNSYPYRMEIDNNDVVHWFCHLRPGAFSWTGNNVISTEGDYILKYDSNGSVIGRTKLDMEAEPFYFSQIDSKEVMAMDKQSGRYYIGGINENQRPLIMGGDTVRERFYIGAFDATGNHLWTREATAPMAATNNGVYDIELDDQGNVYVTGGLDGGSGFMGYNLPLNPPHEAPVLFKLNSSGSLLWGKHGKVVAQTQARALAVSDSEVAITGFFGILTWPGETDTVTGVFNQGYDAFLARFDKENGDLLVMDRTATNFGGQAYGYALHRDDSGAYYMGGNFDQLLYLAGDTLSKVGSQRGFFVAKYQCDLPKVDYTFKADSGGYSFYHTGTEKDSIIWWFGDGSPAAYGDTVWHAYDSVQDYRVCMKVFNDCSDIVHCDTVKAGTVGIEQERLSSLISLYPNPASDKLFVQLNERTNAEVVLSLYSLQGQRVKKQKLENNQQIQALSTSGLPEGIYLILIQQDGELVLNKKLLIKE